MEEVIYRSSNPDFLTFTQNDVLRVIDAHFLSDPAVASYWSPVLRAPPGPEFLKFLKKTQKRPVCEKLLID
jgi:hypothetical protein